MAPDRNNPAPCAGVGTRKEEDTFATLGSWSLPQTPAGCSALCARAVPEGVGVSQTGFPGASLGLRRAIARHTQQLPRFNSRPGVELVSGRRRFIRKKRMLMKY